MRRDERWMLLISFGLYGLNKYFLRKMLTVPFMRCHFNDLMGGIVFGIMLRVAYRFWLKHEIGVMPYLLLVLLAGLYWEYVAPLYLSYSVCDPKDIMAYFAGGAFLWLVLKRENQKKQRK